MLKSIKISGERSCENIQLDNIGSMLALVGRNGAGKTNILLAIQNFAQRSSSQASLSNINGSFSFVARLIILGKTLEYSLTVDQPDINLNEKEPTHPFSVVESLSQVDGNNKILVFARDDEQIILSSSKLVLRTGTRAAAMTAIETFSPNDPAMLLVQPLLEFLRNIRYYDFAEVFSNEAAFIRNSKYEAWKAEGSEHRGLRNVDASMPIAQSVSMRILDMYLSKDGTFDELVDLVGPNGLGLLNQITIFEHSLPSPNDDKPPTNEKFYFLFFIPLAFEKSKRSVPFSDLSFGTRRLISMMVFLLGDKTSLFLVEQPEDGIHTGLLSKVIPTLRSYSDRGQFIFATHASHVLNRLHLDEIRLVEMVSEKTEVRALSAVELAAAKSYLQEDGSLFDFIDSIQEN